MATRKKPAPKSDSPALDPEVIDIPTVSGVEPTAIARVATESHLAAKGYVKTVEALTITTTGDFLTMDQHLGDIRKAQKIIDVLFNHPETGLIKPIRVGLDRLYAFQRQLLLPLDTAEEKAKSKMSAFRLEQKRLKDEREQAERERLRRVQAELDAKRKVDEPAVRVAMMPTVMPAQTPATHSSTSFVKKVRVVSVQQLVEAIEAGLVPEVFGWNLITVDQQVLAVWFKQDVEGVESCPGLDVYDDAQIRGKRG